MKRILIFGIWNLVFFLFWLCGSDAAGAIIVFAWTVWIIQMIIFRITKSRINAEVVTHGILHKSENNSVSLKITGRGDFFKAVLVCVNTLTGEKNKVKIQGNAFKSGGNFDVSVKCINCGRLEFYFDSFKVYDIFGLTYKNIKISVQGFCLCAPVYEDIQLSACDSAAEYSDTSETNKIKALFERQEPFGIREYAAGDSFKDIHWKLSYKLEDIYIREYSSETADKPCLFMETFCSGNCVSLAAAAQKIISCSAMLLNRQTVHYVVVKNSRFNDFTVDLVDSDAAFYSAMGHILSCCPNENKKTFAEAAGMLRTRGIYCAVYFAEKGVAPDSPNEASVEIYS